MKTAASVIIIYTLVITVAYRCRGTNKYFTAQTNILVTQTNCSRHKQILRGTNQYSYSKNKYCQGKNKMFTTQTKTLTAEVYLTAEMIFALSGYLVSLTKYGGILSIR